MTALKTRTWPWIALAGALVALGLFAVHGVAGSILLACGLLTVFGVCIRFISRHDERPRDEPRLPAGHSGI